MVYNTYTIKVAKNPTLYEKKKNIKIKYHMIPYHVEGNTIHLRHCSTNEKIVDIFTKSLGRENFENFKMKLGLKNTHSN